MTRKVIQVALNGVTGRMGYRQHLVRSLLALREQGGLPLDDGTLLYPEPVLVGRSEERLRAIAERHGLSRWTTSLDEVLGDPSVEVYFDTQVTSARETALGHAIAAGKHVYTEKPVAATADAAFALAEAARAAGITHGVVQDKLFLPGVIKLRRLIREGFFGRVLSVRVEFGYWVFEGDGVPAQRPSWNYRAEDGGGIVLDMFPTGSTSSRTCSARSARSTRAGPSTCTSSSSRRLTRTAQDELTEAMAPLANSSTA